MAVPACGHAHGRTFPTFDTLYLLHNMVCRTRYGVGETVCIRYNVLNVHEHPQGAVKNSATDVRHTKSPQPNHAHSHLALNPTPRHAMLPATTYYQPRHPQTPPRPPPALPQHSNPDSSQTPHPHHAQPLSHLLEAREEIRATGLRAAGDVESAARHRQIGCRRQTTEGARADEIL